jgi:hypothetical protein
MIIERKLRLDLGAQNVTIRYDIETCKNIALIQFSHGIYRIELVGNPANPAEVYLQVMEAIKQQHPELLV